MTAASIMFAGTGSDVGKSLLVAGLARAYTRRGLTVRPFKPQNMSNNAAVTMDGGEIGRAQALQARAARCLPMTDMNPVLLKPQSDVGSQVVVQGRVAGTAKARDYQAWKPRLMTAVQESFARLASEADLVLVEGAGSIAEINLRANDIANMGFAAACGVPVVVIGDIDRGGVIAQLVGTNVVLSDADRAMVRGFIVNRFRGDPRLFADGMSEIAARTGWTPIGLVPFFDGAADLPAEDAVALERPTHVTGPAAGADIQLRCVSWCWPTHVSPTSTISIRSSSTRHSISALSGPVRLCRVTPISSFCRARKPRLRTSPRSGTRAGISISQRTSGAAGTSGGFVAGIKCSAGASPIQTASKGRHKRSTVLGFWMSRPC
jgi:dethiobiotin synthetase